MRKKELSADLAFSGLCIALGGTEGVGVVPSWKFSKWTLGSTSGVASSVKDCAVWGTLLFLPLAAAHNTYKIQNIPFFSAIIKKQIQNILKKVNMLLKIMFIYLFLINNVEIGHCFLFSNLTLKCISRFMYIHQLT